MKKIYQTPTTVIVKLETMTIVAVSLGVDDNRVNASEAEASSYRNSLWGDNE